MREDDVVMKQRGVRRATALCVGWLGLFALWLTLGGCPNGAATSGPKTEVCARVGDQCKLRDGLLGVCVATTEQECESPPCFFCQPQH